MFTPTEVHYLVGLLYSVLNPKNVSIELGSMLLDEAINDDRDVDIAITYEDEKGGVNQLLGVEVKRHKRPLDVEHVEQLCIKFADISVINKRGIVSTSGYTANAIKKAQHHNVDLYAFEDWDSQNEQLENVRVDKDFSGTIKTYQWAGSPHVLYLLDESIPLEEVTPYFNMECAVTDHNNQPMPHAQNLSELSNHIIQQVLDQAKNHESLANIAPDKEISVPITIGLTDKPRVIINSKDYVLNGATITGKIIARLSTPTLIYKKLQKLNEPISIGCILSEVNGNLTGITFSGQSVHFINIPVIERSKKQIRRHKLTTNA